MRKDEREREGSVSRDEEAWFFGKCVSAVRYQTSTFAATLGLKVGFPISVQTQKIFLNIRLTHLLRWWIFARGTRMFCIGE